MIRRLLPIFILACTYLIGQAYTLFNNPHYDSLGTINWILYENKPMLISWNVKYLCEEINRIIEAIAFLMMLWDGRKIYTLAAVTYLTYRIMDIIFYWVNFKTYNYGWIFVLIALTESILWLHTDIKAIIKKK